MSSPADLPHRSPRLPMATSASDLSSSWRTSAPKSEIRTPIPARPSPASTDKHNASGPVPTGSLARGGSGASSRASEPTASVASDFDHGNYVVPSSLGDIEGDGVPRYASRDVGGQQFDEDVDESRLSFDSDSALSSATQEPAACTWSEVPHAVHTQSQPPPREGMVYYPAPVPLNLNMPKRLSKAPPASRLDPAAAQKAMLNSKSKLPPQLRASIFFEQESVAHSIQIKDGSAVATLDSLLDASARAPINHSTHQLFDAQTTHGLPRPNTLSSLLEMRSEAGKNRRSRLSLRSIGSGTFSLSHAGTLSDAHNGEDGSSQLSHRPESMADDGPGSDAGEDGFIEHGLRGRSGNMPATLIAELQLRKHQLNTRTRNAASSHPNGMRSTLLQLDAVRQIEKKRRQAKRTTLAWEDPESAALANDSHDDEDVPLGVLFPPNTGPLARTAGADWDRPVGLIEKRLMEDNEPLSKRRERLIKMNASRASSKATVGRDDSDDENESLAQRARRLKTAKAPADAIQEGRADFGSETWPHFEDINLDNEARSMKPKSNASMVEFESGIEETLARRRDRLRAQKAAQSTGQSNSLLSSHVAPPRPTQTLNLQGKAVKVSYAGNMTNKDRQRLQNAALTRPGPQDWSSPNESLSRLGYLPTTAFSQQSILQMAETLPAHTQDAGMLPFPVGREHEVDRWRQDVKESQP